MESPTDSYVSLTLGTALGWSDRLESSIGRWCIKPQKPEGRKGRERERYGIRYSNPQSLRVDTERQRWCVLEKPFLDSFCCLSFSPVLPLSTLCSLLCSSHRLGIYEFTVRLLYLPQSDMLDPVLAGETGESGVQSFTSQKSFLRVTLKLRHRRTGLGGSAQRNQSEPWEECRTVTRQYRSPLRRIKGSERNGWIMPVLEK